MLHFDYKKYTKDVTRYTSLEIPCIKKVEFPPMSTLVIFSLEEVQNLPIHHILSPGEELVYAHHSFSKQNDWLVGRFAAKSAIAGQIQEELGYSPELSDIEIITRVLARPIFCLLKLRSMDFKKATNIEKKVMFSLAHSHGFATAKTSYKTRESIVGVDIEKIRSFAPKTLLGFLTSNEYQLYTRLSYGRQKMYATLLWCLKEAYLKAKGAGLTMHPRRIEVLINSAGSTWDFFEDGQLIDTSSQWTLSSKQCIVTHVCIHKA